MPVPSRIGIFAVACVACAWFALGAVQAHNVATVTAIVSSGSQLSKNQATRADSLLADAGTLNPDSQVDLLRAQVALGRGERARALKLIRRINAREPANILAWYWLERAAPNLSTFYVGAYHILILEPRVR